MFALTALESSKVSASRWNDVNYYETLVRLTMLILPEEHKEAGQGSV